MVQLPPFAQVLLWPLNLEDPISDGCRATLSPLAPTSAPWKHQVFLTPLLAGGAFLHRYNPSSPFILPQTFLTSSLAPLPSLPPTAGLTQSSLREAIARDMLGNDGWVRAGSSHLHQGQRIGIRAPRWYHMDPKMLGQSLILTGDYSHR